MLIAVEKYCAALFMSRGDWNTFRVLTIMLRSHTFMHRFSLHYPARYNYDEVEVHLSVQHIALLWYANCDEDDVL